MIPVFWLFTVAMCAVGALVFQGLGVLATLVWFLWNAIGALVWAGLAWYDVRTDGYVLEKYWAPDGKHRWRIGVRDAEGRTCWTEPKKPS